MATAEKTSAKVELTGFVGVKELGATVMRAMVADFAYSRLEEGRFAARKGNVYREVSVDKLSGDMDVVLEEWHDGSEAWQEQTVIEVRTSTEDDDFTAVYAVSTMTDSSGKVHKREFSQGSDRNTMMFGEVEKKLRTVKRVQKQSK